MNNRLDNLFNNELLKIKFHDTKSKHFFKFNGVNYVNLNINVDKILCALDTVFK